MIREKLTSSKLTERIICLSILFVIAFFGATIISYLALPEGFLLNKNKATDFHVSSHTVIRAIQIFFWNMISVLMIMIGSLFGKKQKESDKYISLGYWVYFIAILLAAITLGTWSFTHATNSVPIFERIISMFHIFKNAGLVELYGQLLITCALSDKYLVMTFKNKTTTRKVNDVTWRKSEVLCLAIGLLLMFFGAFIESKSMFGV